MMLRVYSVGNRIRVKRWWNDTDSVKAMYSENNLSHCHYVDVERSGTEPVPP